SAKLIDQADQKALKVNGETDKLLNEVKVGPEKDPNGKINTDPLKPVMPKPPNYLSEFENAELGAKLGKGGNKDVFALKGHDDKVIGILREGDSFAPLQDEIALLEQ